jgi:hypothetical protein
MKKNSTEEIDAIVAYKLIEIARAVLKGMQGPERHLVGDVAERIPRQDVVKVSKTGRRGVGKIAGAVELRQYVERKIKEAREGRSISKQMGWSNLQDTCNGKVKALVDLKKWLDVKESQRSDLPNH